MKSGRMPQTDYYYEEFEGLLASYYLTLLPLKDSSLPEDREDFTTAVAILDLLASRLDLLKPEVAAREPRPTPMTWGQPKVITPCWSIIDLMNSFIVDFGVGIDENSVETKARCRLGQTLVGILARHQVLEPEFSTVNEIPIPVGVKAWDETRRRLSLAEVLASSSS